MENPIYYSPIEKNLYRLKNDSKIECQNQSYFESDPLGDFMLVAQERYETILEQFECLNKRFFQDSMKSDFHQNELKHILHHQQNLLNEVVNTQQSLPDQMHQTKEELKVSLLSNQWKMKNELQNELLDTQNKITNSNQTQNGEYYRLLLENINQLRELIENPDPYSFFRFGDHIILTDITGNSISDVFIQSTENEIVWVNNLTMNLSITNKKGVTISKA